MNAIRRTLRRLLTDQKGATAIEYGLIAALIVIAMMGGLRSWRAGHQLVGQVQTNSKPACPNVCERRRAQARRVP